MHVPKSRIWLYATVALSGLAIDLATKSWMFHWLGMPGGRRFWVWTGILSFETVLNEGALFGQGQGFGILFICLSVVALLGIVYWLFRRRAAADLFLTVTLAAISGGIVGNLYDRAGLPGLAWHRPMQGHQLGEPVYAVRDWIHFQILDLETGKQHFDWPVFNIADCLLVCGVAALALHAYVLEPLRSRREKQAAKAEGATTKPSACAS
ncbi:MAG: signal peptidase II [Planctomycetia bacterium]|nr:signal peptidase II [Planctomycetia bacterium]